MTAGALGKKIILELDATTAALRSGFQEGKKVVSDFKAQFVELKEVIEASLAFKAGEFAIDKIKEIGEAIGEMVERGHEVSSVADGFAELGGKASTLQAATQATLGMVDATSLMQAENKGLISQGPAFDKYFADITKVATAYAEKTGVAIPEALDKLVTMLDHGSKKIVDFGYALEESGTAAQKAAGYYDQTAGLAAKTSKPVEDAGTAFDSLKASVKNANDQFDVGITSNVELQSAFKKLNTEVKSIDWKKLGEDVSGVFTIIVQAADDALPHVQSVITNFSRGFQFLFGSGLQSQADHLASQIQDVQTQITSMSNAMKPDGNTGSLTKWLEGDNQSNLDALKAKLAGLNSQFVDTTSQLAKQQAQQDKNTDSQKKGNDETGRSAGLLKVQGEAAADTATAEDKLNEKIQQQNTELSKLKDSNVAAGIKTNIDQALKEGNFAGAASLIPAYEDATTKVIDDEIAKRQFATPEMAANFREVMVNEANTKITDDFKNKLQAAFQQSVQFFESSIEDIWSNGITRFLENSLKQIAEGFAAQMLASMTGVNVVGGFAGIGQQLAGNTSGVGLQSLASLFSGGAGALSGIGPLASGSAYASELGAGIGPVANGADYASMLGENTTALQGVSGGMGGLSSGMAALAPPLMLAGVAYEAGSSWYKNDGGGSILKGKGNSSDYLNTALDATPMTMWINPLLNALGVGNVGSVLGLGGGKPNATTQAIQGVGGYLTQQGDSQLGSTFNVSSHDFDSGASGLKELSSLSKDDQNAFTGLGDALAAIAGVAKEVGPQVGAILATDFTGNLNDARDAMENLNMSAGDMENAVIQAGLKAGKTWAQIEADIQGVDKVMTPAKGDIAGVMQGIVDSAGSGMSALKELQNLAVTGAQTGAKTMTDLKNKLDAVYDPSQVQIMFQAFNAYGITSLNQLQNASQNTLIAIIAMMQNLGFTFQDVQSDASSAVTSVNNLADAVGGIPAVPTSTTVTPHAKGGIVNSPTYFNTPGGLGLMGESGPEAILPLTRVGGVLGVKTSNQSSSGGGGISIYVNVAPGVQAGVAQEIRAALESMEPNVIQKSVAATMDAFRHGGGNLP